MHPTLTGLPPRGEVEGPSLAGVVGQRAVAYRLFGQCLLPPRPNRVAAMAGAVDELSTAQAFADFACHAVWEGFLRRVDAYVRRDPDERMAAYVRRFQVSNQVPPIPLTESTARAVTPEGGAAIAGALALEYAAAGVRETPHGAEPADHVAVELEFMAMLCDQESAAWTLRQRRSARRCLRRQRRFLQQHLLVALPLLASHLSGLGPDVFHGQVIAAAGEFAIHDAALASGLISTLDQESVDGAA